jgi:organic radical activating enzyme
MKSDRPHLQKTIDKLDSVSPSFCAAKWSQVTLHLQNGHNHSCHHPGTHVVSVDEIKRNYKSLHNSDYKKSLRKMMLEGERPKECNYCWKVEDQGDSLSDRVYKSATNWSFPYIDGIVSKNWNEDFDPTYMEVSFSNVCNFKCSYCAPHISSQWMEEVERYGAYPGSNHGSLDWVKIQKQMPIPNREKNPFVDAFWQWWPELYNSLEHFRITGGEPLMSKNTFKVLEFVKQNPNKKLHLAFNSNLCVTDDLFERFLEEIKFITKNELVASIHIYTSAEAHGAQSDFIRFGMDYNKWLFNIRRIMKEVPEVNVTIMSTFNLLSVFSYKQFLQNVLDIKKKFPWNISNQQPRLVLNIPYLNYPKHQTMFLIDPLHKNKIFECVDFMKSNLVNHLDRNKGGFELTEVELMERIYNLSKDYQLTEEDNLHRKNFVLFVDEHDKRRGTNFLETFPEFSEMYNEWKKI